MDLTGTFGGFPLRLFIFDSRKIQLERAACHDKSRKTCRIFRGFLSTAHIRSREAAFCATHASRLAAASHVVFN